MGALRSGAGLVTVATPACCQPIVAAMAPEYMTVPLGELTDDLNQHALNPDGVDDLLEMARDVVALGPGLGQAPATKQFIKSLVDRASAIRKNCGAGLKRFIEAGARLRFMRRIVMGDSLGAGAAVNH